MKKGAVALKPEPPPKTAFPTPLKNDMYEMFNPSKVFWSLFSLLIFMLHQVFIGVRRESTYVIT